jgi:hypothetical protein
VDIDCVVVKGRVACRGDAVEANGTDAGAS